MRAALGLAVTVALASCGGDDIPVSVDMVLEETFGDCSFGGLVPRARLSTEEPAMLDFDYANAGSYVMDCSPVVEEGGFLITSCTNNNGDPGEGADTGEVSIADDFTSATVDIAAAVGCQYGLTATDITPHYD